MSSKPKILLVGNYSPDRQHSMRLFCDTLSEGVREKSFHVSVVKPVERCGALLGRVKASRKWFGYIDKYLLFPPSFRRAAADADIVHICDHSNAVYGQSLGGRLWLVTCHDLLAVRSALGEFSENPTRASGRLLQKWILGSLKKAPCIVPISQATKRDVVRLVGEAHSSAPVIRNGLNYPYELLAADHVVGELMPLLGSRVASRYVLHVGGDAWYKNREIVLKSFAGAVSTIGDDTLSLVLVGPRNSRLFKLAEDLDIAGRAVFLDAVSARELNALYCGAQAFVFPSLAEGFGWPVLEALACGCPTATSDREPMTEVAGHAAIYCNPESVGSVKEALCFLLQESISEREQRKRSGLEQASLFSATKMIEGYCDLYEQLFMQGGKQTAFATN